MRSSSARLVVLALALASRVARGARVPDALASAPAPSSNLLRGGSPRSLFPNPEATLANASDAPPTSPCEACCGGGSCDAAFRGTPGTCCGIVAGTPFCCPTSRSSYGSAKCLRADDVFRCQPAGDASSRGGQRKVSPWYALFSLLVPIACLGMCCYAIFKRPSAPPPTQYCGPGGQPLPPGGYYQHGGAGAAVGYPTQQQQGGYGASNLAGAGATFDTGSSAYPPPTYPPPPPKYDGRAAPTV